MVKVIFLENVEDHKVGDIKEVAPGYARNYLFKQNLAKLATDEEVKNLESKIKELQKEEGKRVEDAQKTADKLAKEKIVLTEEVNEEGHLYGSVGAKEIADKLEISINTVKTIKLRAFQSLRSELKINVFSFFFMNKG
jgi:large subunit ribosomal protein L9